MRGRKHPVSFILAVLLEHFRKMRVRGRSHLNELGASIIRHSFCGRIRAMARKVLREGQWDRVNDLLPGKATDRGATAKIIDFFWRLLCG